MATISDNTLFYDQYDWSCGGEEWADAWGGSDMQWFGTILPRIHRFLPAKTIVEIGAGYGRWVNYFLPYCERLILVDLTKQCVDHCRQKYAGNAKVKCIQNSGASLDFISSNSADFIFSYHSLVHADDKTMQAYAVEIEKKLTPQGAAFIHHSNAGEYVNDVTLEQAELADYRDISMTAEKMREYAKAAGLRCSTQELVNWETHQLLDSFSVMARPNAIWGRSNVVFKNNHFMNEMAHYGRMAELYGLGQTRATPPYLYRLDDSNQ